MLENIIVKPNARRTRYALQIGDQGEVIVKTPLNPSESVVADLVRDHQSIKTSTKSRQPKNVWPVGKTPIN